MKTQAVRAQQTVTVDLEARPTQWEVAAGLTVPGYGFSGQVPGPTIEAEVGDTLVVRLANSLPEPTTIHWHGLRVPADMDGTELGSTRSSRETASSTGSCCPTPGPSGTTPTPTRPNSWRRACTGPWSCAAPASPSWMGERVLVLDDLKLDRHGNLARFGGWKERHQGRLGEPGWSTAAPTQSLRWRPGRSSAGGW